MVVVFDQSKAGKLWEIVIYDIRFLNATRNDGFDLIDVGNQFDSNFATLGIELVECIEDDLSSID
jgi:hypothetical protein